MSEREVPTARDETLSGRGTAPPRDDDLRRRLLEILLVTTERPRMTYEEFLAWADEDTSAEWVGGEVVL